MMSAIGQVPTPAAMYGSAAAGGSSIMQQTGQKIYDEWQGQTSQKFRGNKLHVAEPLYKETKHPLFQAE